MKDEDKTKDQIVSELIEARQRITELEVSETLRNRIDEVLMTSESQYRSTLDSIGEMIHVIDTELRFILFNTAFKQLNIELGFDTDVIGKKITDMYPFLPDKIFEEYNEVFNTGKTLVTEERITIRGKKFITETRKIPIFEEGRVTQIVTIIHDITERIQIEDALRMSEERYRTFLQNFLGIAYRGNLDFTPLFFHGAVEEITGYTEEEFLSEDPRWDQIIYPEDLSTLKGLEEVRSIPNYSTEREYRIVHKDGEIRWVKEFIQNVCDASLKPILVQGAIYDVTEHKKAEENIKKMKEKYESLIDNIPDIIYSALADATSTTIFVSDRITDWTGYSPFEFYNDNNLWSKCIHYEDRQEAVESFINAYTSKKEYIFEYRVVHKETGQIYHLSDHGVPIKDDKGRVIRFDGILTDISERKQAEERYRGLYESSIDGIVSAYIGGEIIECNQAFADMLGYTKEELFKLKLRDLIPYKWHSLLDKIMEEQLLQKGYTEEFEIEHIQKDGTIFPASVRIWVIKNKVDEPMGLWAIVRDITERRILEEELQKLEKLESIGILAGGIAHDFNNILTAILANISVAKMSSKSNEIVSKRLTEAEKASIRAKDLTQQLLTFSIGGAPIKRITSLLESLKDTVKFALSGTNVSSRFYLSDELWSVEVDEGQISQVIHNLVINADQAMPEGGIIEIHADNITIGPESGLPLNVGNYVRLTIRDHGIGIPKEYLPKIFDPYFTTKQKGSGLGLTVAYSIIKNHDGHITVESEMSKGTAFSIYIPASKTQIHAKNDTESKPITGKGKILVMDDEEIIRDALDEILTILGYQADFAKNGEEVITLFKEAKELEEPFDLVIMDLTIKGGMGGKEAIKRLIEIDPEVKAVVSSGYSTDPVMANFKKHGFCSVVAKPYDIKELSKTLHKIIQG